VKSEGLRTGRRKLRDYGLYLIREHALVSIRVHGCDDVIIRMAVLNRGVGVVCAGGQGRVYLAIRSTGDGSAIHVITNHIGRGACIPAQRDTVCYGSGSTSGQGLKGWSSGSIAGKT